MRPPGLCAQISRDELETVREVKTKLTRLTMRVERVRKVWYPPAWPIGTWVCQRQLQTLALNAYLRTCDGAAGLALLC